MTGGASRDGEGIEGPGAIPPEQAKGEQIRGAAQDQQVTPAVGGGHRISRRAAARALAFTLTGALAGWGIGYAMGLSGRTGTSASSQAAVPSRYVLPFEWGDLGVRLVREGAVDRDKLVSRFSRSPALPYLTAVLDGRASPGSQEVTAENADVLLDLLWAFGLANRNPVLLDGPIGGDKLRIGGYASTGGWTLARGDGPSHFAASDLVALDPTQQARVESLAKRIYRPCCNNPTWFPDCNHGMAMLGLLELMAARGTSEQDMARAALGANTRWFPQQYQDLARLLGLQGKRWEDGDPLELLGDQYSSAGGVQKWRAALPPSAPGAPSSGGCAA